MREFLEFVIRQLIEFPDDMVLTEIPSGRTRFLRCNFDEETSVALSAGVARPFKLFARCSPVRPRAMASGRSSKSSSRCIRLCSSSVSDAKPTAFRRNALQCYSSQVKIDILTLFPDICRAPLGESIMKRAQENGIIDLRIHNLRDWTTDKHHIVDDAPFGGGQGMVMKPEPIFAAVEELRGAKEKTANTQRPTLEVQQSKSRMENQKLL